MNKRNIKESQVSFHFVILFSVYLHSELSPYIFDFPLSPPQDVVRFFVNNVENSCSSITYSVETFRSPNTSFFNVETLNQENPTDQMPPQDITFSLEVNDSSKLF